MLVHLALLIGEKSFRAVDYFARLGHDLVDDSLEFRFQVARRAEVLQGQQDQHDGGDDERQLEKAAEKPEQTDGGKDNEKDDYPIFGCLLYTSPSPRDRG